MSAGVPRAVLIGPPGSGKSTVARHLADQLGVALRDADADVEEVAGMTVADIFVDQGEDGRIRRLSNRAGGVEGGMSNGEVVRVRAAMKPISTVPRALATVDVATGEPAKAQHQRSDVCAVPPAAVVAEAMVALVLAEQALEKFGGDSVAEVRRNAEAYLAAIPELQR